MEIYKLQTQHIQFLADTTTPVNIYLKLRDYYPNSLLLESSDYNSADNSYSYICCNPIASIKIDDDIVNTHFPNGTADKYPLQNQSIIQIIEQFTARFESAASEFKFITNGLFGYMSYDCFRYFENINLTDRVPSTIPDLYYAIYKNVIAINHFKQEAYIFCHTLDGSSNIDEVIQHLQSPALPAYRFTKSGARTSNFNDIEFVENINTTKEYCQSRDVRQLAISRRFSQEFKGDEFNVYRALRSINHSPYLFYFDYGNFKMFGASPEAHLTINNGKAEIRPIAGTFTRSDNEVDDIVRAKELIA
jgi:anthranilate synthase component 1